MSSVYSTQFSTDDKKIPVTDLEDVVEESSSSDHPVEPPHSEHLNRSLSTRTINMITIAGIIGTGLFLSSGRMLKTAGPLGLLLNYLIIGILIFFMMLCLGEMSVQYPVSGSFSVYAKRFGSDSLAFAVLVNYWLNDCVSVAADLTALQLVFQYWTDFHCRVWTCVA
ncbi:Amino acid transporter 1 [Candida tropicalis]